MTTPTPASTPRFWRLDGFTDYAGNPVTPKTEWNVGGIYQHLTSEDGSPPMFGGWDEQSLDFFGLVWTEVGDPRQKPAPDASRP